MPRALSGSIGLMTHSTHSRRVHPASFGLRSWSLDHAQRDAINSDPTFPKMPGKWTCRRHGGTDANDPTAVIRHTRRRTVPISFRTGLFLCHRQSRLTQAVNEMLDVLAAPKGRQLSECSRGNEIGVEPENLSCLRPRVVELSQVRIGHGQPNTARTMIRGLRDKITERWNRFRIPSEEDICQPQIAASDRQRERINSQVRLGDIDGTLGLTRESQDCRQIANR